MKIDKKIIMAFVILGFFLSRLYRIGNGLNLLEPDESDYQFVADGFSSGWPILRGELYLEQFPLFTFLAYLVRPLKIFGPYLPVRFWAAGGALMVGIGLYYWVKERVSWEAGIWSLILFWLLPLSLFYSRSGTLDMLMMGFAFLSFYFFEKEKRIAKRLGIIAGIFFGLAVLTKTAALVFSLYFLLTGYFNKERRKRFIWFFIGSGLLLFFSYGPFWLYFRESMGQTHNLVERHFLPLFNPTVHLAVVWIYLSKLAFFLSWPIILLTILGGFFINSRKKTTKGVVFGLLPWLFFIFLFDYSPRYLLLLTPSVAILSGIAISRLRLAFLKLIILFLILPASLIAWQSTWHQGMEAAAKQVSRLSSEVALYATFDPEKFERSVGRNVSLLVPEATESGIVVVDERKSELLLSFTEPKFQEARRILDWIRTEAQPAWEYQDPWPHFPGTDKGNKFMIYKFSNE